MSIAYHNILSNSLGSKPSNEILSLTASFGTPTCTILTNLTYSGLILFTFESVSLLETEVLSSLTCFAICSSCFSSFSILTLVTMFSDTVFSGSVFTSGIEDS